MTAISMAVASERAKRYRELAHDARVQATRSEHVPRIAWAYMSMAVRWEEFALEADAEAEDMSGSAPDSGSAAGEVVVLRGYPSAGATLSSNFSKL